jgi:hypothetical protein
MKMMTKIELSFNRIAKIQDLSDLAFLLFPHNKRHQKVFLAIFIELKYSEDGFLPSLNWIADKYKFSRRLLEIVRAKLRRLGIIDHVSRFSGSYGYREGWIFSSRFHKSLSKLSDAFVDFKSNTDPKQELKDRDSFRYL